MNLLFGSNKMQDGARYTGSSVLNGASALNNLMSSIFYSREPIYISLLLN